MKSPYAAYRAESTLSAAEATFLLEVVDEFREWICWKYGDKMRDYCRENNLSKTEGLEIDENNPF